jgi:hypothetical protein
MPESQAAAARDPDALERDLREARDALADAETAVETHGEAALRDLQAALRDLDLLFEQYEDAATGTGDFESYIKFQEDIVDLVEGLDEDLPEYDQFESLLELFKQRRLSEGDFDEARARLQDARGLAGRVETLEAAREEHRSVQRRVRDVADEYADEVEHLERLQRLGNADLDAPVEDLREPIRRYDDAVREAFRDFRDNEAAADVLGFVATTRAYPLVPFDPAPEDLAAFVADRDAGGEPIPQLLEYAEYSPSKLDHYVDAPRALKRAVGGNRTYLDRLTADPLTVGWPPAPAEELQYRLDELVSVVARFAGDDVLAPLHEVRRRVREDDYDRLRTAAQATHELTDDERARIESGVEEDLRRAREAEQQLRDALDEY